MLSLTFPTISSFKSDVPQPKLKKTVRNSSFQQAISNLLGHSNETRHVESITIESNEAFVAEERHLLQKCEGCTSVFLCCMLGSKSGW